MGKILTRIGLIGLIAWGGWYLWTSDNGKTKAPVEKIETQENAENPAKKEENLTFEIKKGEKSEIVEKKKENTKKVIVKTNSNTPSSTSSVISEKIAEKEVASVKNNLTKNIAKFVENEEATTVNVYFYDYGIDLSSKNVAAGNVIFRAKNNGRLSHDLTLKDGNGQVKFGRVAPGETKYFKINLSNGEFEVFSDLRVDKEHDMSEVLTAN